MKKFKNLSRVLAITASAAILATGVMATPAFPPIDGNQDPSLKVVLPSKHVTISPDKGYNPVVIDQVQPVAQLGSLPAVAGVTNANGSFYQTTVVTTPATATAPAVTGPSASAKQHGPVTPSIKIPQTASTHATDGSNFGGKYPDLTSSGAWGGNHVNSFNYFNLDVKPSSSIQNNMNADIEFYVEKDGVRVDPVNGPFKLEVLTTGTAVPASTVGGSGSAVKYDNIMGATATTPPTVIAPTDLIKLPSGAPAGTGVYVSAGLIAPVHTTGVLHAGYTWAPAVAGNMYYVYDEAGVPIRAIKSTGSNYLVDAASDYSPASIQAVYDDLDNIDAANTTANVYHFFDDQPAVAAGQTLVWTPVTSKYLSSAITDFTLDAGKITTLNFRANFYDYGTYKIAAQIESRDHKVAWGQPIGFTVKVAVPGTYTTTTGEAQGSKKINTNEFVIDKVNENAHFMLNTSWEGAPSDLYDDKATPGLSDDVGPAYKITMTEAPANSRFQFSHGNETTIFTYVNQKDPLFSYILPIGKSGQVDPFDNRNITVAGDKAGYYKFKIELMAPNYQGRGDQVLSTTNVTFNVGNVPVTSVATSSVAGGSTTTKPTPTKPTTTATTKPTTSGTPVPMPVVPGGTNPKTGAALPVVATVSLVGAGAVLLVARKRK